MANYTARKAKHATAAAGVTDTVTLTFSGTIIEIINRSTDALYARVDDTNVTVAGDDCEVIPAGLSLVVEATPGDTSVTVIIAAGGAYSVVTR